MILSSLELAGLSANSKATGWPKLGQKYTVFSTFSNLPLPVCLNFTSLCMAWMFFDCVTGIPRCRLQSQARETSNSPVGSRSVLSFLWCSGRHSKSDSYFHLSSHPYSNISLPCPLVSMLARFTWRISLTITPWDFFLRYHFRRTLYLLLLKRAGIMWTNK